MPIDHSQVSRQYGEEANTEGAANPLWLTWERAGSPSPSRDFPRAGAFSMWLREKWKQYKLEHGLNALPRHGRNSWEQNDWLRMKYREQFHKWLEEGSESPWRS